jgi:hypothetical protein
MSVNPLITYYIIQAQGGDLGGVHRSYRVQKGEGLGSFLSNIFRTVFPLFKSGAKAIGSQALSTGIGLLKDAITGKPIKESFRDRITEAGQNLTSKAASKMEQMVGNGYKRGTKRKRSQSKRNIKRRKRSNKRSGPRKKARKTSRGKVTKRRKLSRFRDIFG